MSFFKGNSLFNKGLRTNRVKSTGAVVLFLVSTILVLSGFAQFFLSPVFDQDVTARFLGPSLRHWMGTDALGRDLFSRVLYGSIISLGLGVAATCISFFLGALIGSFAGWQQGLVGKLFLGAVDTFLAVPQIVFLILIKIGLDLILADWSPFTRGLLGILVGLSLLGWTRVARMVYFEICKIKQEPFVAAGKALGKTPLRLLLWDILPNIFAPLAVLFAFRVSGNILYESFLSFIGLGLQAPYGSWGKLVAEGLDHLESAPHLALFPGFTLVLTLYFLQMWTDRLRHYWDADGFSVGAENQRHREMI